MVYEIGITKWHMNCVMVRSDVRPQQKTHLREKKYVKSQSLESVSKSL